MEGFEALLLLFRRHLAYAVDEIQVGHILELPTDELCYRDKLRENCGTEELAYAHLRPLGGLTEDLVIGRLPLPFLYDVANPFQFRTH